MRDEPIGAYLDRLAAREPAPGGGAAAALHAAQGAALVAMVARYTSGPRYAEHAEHAEQVARITGQADALAERALGLAAEDEAAFGDVAAAYRLPRDTEADKAARSAAIAEATVGATVPPAEVIAVSREIVALAEALLPIGNPNVVTDIAAAAEAARAAAATSRVNIEINLAGVGDPERSADLRAVAAEVDAVSTAAEKITARVREVISR